MRRPLTIWAALSLIAAVLTSIVAGSTAIAAPDAPTQAPTPYSGSGTADLLEVDANIPAVDPAHVILSPVASAVNSETTPNSVADGANLDAGLLDDNIPLDELLTQAHQEALPDNAEPTVDGPLVPVGAAPLLDLGVSTSSAHARWLESGGCLPAGTNYTTAFNETASADVLVLGEDTDGTNQSVVSLVAPEGGATGTRSEIAMTGDGAVRGLQSTSYTQVAEASLLEGTPLELHVSVSDVPTLTASADGTPGGAAVTYNDPLITIEAGPDGALAPLEELGTALNDLLKETVLRELVGAGIIESVANQVLEALGNPVVIDYGVGSDTLVQDVDPDGKFASGDVSVLRLHITVLPLDTSLPVVSDLVQQVLQPLGLFDIELNVDLGHMSAAVAVPQGGISCGPEINPFADLHKDSTVAEVAPGGQFDYTLTIPNHPQSGCDLTNVVVTDTITSPPGTEITSTPAADSVDGDTLTWNIGDLPVNESRTITVHVKVPEDAPDGFTFTDVLKASGDCNGTPVDHTVELKTPTVTDDFTGPCNLGDSNKASSHLEVLPGQTFSYFVHVFNSGAEPCSDVSVTDTLDDQVAFVSCTYDCSNSGQEVAWSGITVPGGSGVTLAVTVKAADDATGTLSNTAVIDSPDDDDGPHTVTVNGPDVTDRSVPAPPNPAKRGDRGPLPKTGVELPIALGVFALLSLGFLALRRRMSTVA